MVLEFFLMLAVTTAVSIFVNFLNRDDKRMPWSRVFIFVVVFTIVFWGTKYILNMM
ncbi:hypothetical protein [Jeotgalicoccus nanhaiensis]|uniref:Uncharacterized protein n=1 Tax=Jeotgalicoccus nanhaiensis TaxID=568603 RepID=A0ABR9XX66_9STAP|nr:hypothetical protein [Jeotgalicoccus nanhaiensis]MBF0753054.1 hypothetical protein [Jeotgalicoccus nanhaiensis]